MEQYDQFLFYAFLGNTLQTYIKALLVFAATWVILHVFKNVVLKKLKSLVEATTTDFDDLIIKVIDTITWPFYFFISLYIAVQFVSLPQIVNQVIGAALLILIVYYAVRAAQTIIGFGFDRVLREKLKEDTDFDPSAINLLERVAIIALWATALMLVLQNLGYNVSTLLAGLGLGGIAFAFAIQNILKDIFASFSIYFDRPFKTGDFIVIGQDKGVVKHIGIKSTRIQTLQGQELVISNKELTESRVQNYKHMERRRITFGFGVTYETPVSKLKKIPTIVRKILKQNKLAEIERVHFKEFGDFSLNFEVVYYVNSSEYGKYMDTQQKINLSLLKEFEQEGIEMAYPTQTIYLNKLEK